MSKSTKICPYCGEEIKEVAVICRYCKSDLRLTLTNENFDPQTLIKSALIDRYEIIDKVGIGGMAVVYKACQKSLNRNVALKVIHQNLVHDKEFITRFTREAQVSASLNHPNIITVYDVGSVGSVHYISMELLQGKTLAELIREKGICSVDEVIGFIKPIAEALEYLHTNRLVHRDIKCSNIYITKNNRPVLTDFGIVSAGAGKSVTQVGAILGTPEYMSPEQAEGKRELDGRSDLYSLGIVIYECLSGKVPFTDENPLTTIYLKLHEKPTPIRELNPDVPEWLEKIISSLLETEVAYRIKSGSDLIKSLEIKTVIVPEVKPEKKEDIKPSKRKGKKTKTHTPEAESIKKVKKPRQAIRRKSSRGIVIGIIITAIIMLASCVYFLTEFTDFSFRDLNFGKVSEPSLDTELSSPLAEKPVINMIEVKGGSFNMGSDMDTDTKPVHRVSINTFFISKYEITNLEYSKFLNSIKCQPDGIYKQHRLIALNSASSHIKFSNNQFSVHADFENHPVVNVSWHGAVLFCQWYGSRLPTEAEWEYAAKGGKNQQPFFYSGSDKVDDVGWYMDNSNGELKPVGMKTANNAGIYDMTGNAWEWCMDNYDRQYYANSGNNNPSGPRKGSFKVVRGGSYYCPETLMKNTFRLNFSPDDFINREIGFRVCKPG